MVLHPNFPTTPLGLHPLDREQHRGRHAPSSPRCPCSATASTASSWNGSDRHAHVRPQPDHAARPADRQRRRARAPRHGQRERERQPQRWRHAFGPDGKLYVFMGDQGRRGWMQNLANGPFLTAPFVDDTFGGPGARQRPPVRRDRCGSTTTARRRPTTPSSRPARRSAARSGANIQKVFSYGHRNGFGMAFDPSSGSLWDTENADDAFSELNRVVPGMNGGWIQIAGPLEPHAPTSSSSRRRSSTAPAAGPLPADPRRVHAGARHVADVHAAGRHLRRSRAELEVRDRSGRDDVRAGAPRSGPHTTARCGSDRPGASSRSAATAEASTGSSSRPTGCTST